MLDLLYKLKEILNPRERRNAVILFCLILIAGTVESIGIASIMPFLAVLADPHVIQESDLLFAVYQKLGFTTADSFLIFLGIVVFLVMIAGLFLKALTQYAIARFSQMRNYSLSRKLMVSYLSRPYSWFLDRHSADLGKTVLSEVQQVIQKALLPAAQFIVHAVIAVCLIVLLLLVNPVVALLAAALLGVMYAAVYLSMRKYLKHIGTDRLKANRERFQVAQEALGGIKEVKAGRLEAGYIASFGKPAHRYARRQAASMIINQVPRYFLQAVTFGGIIALTLVLLAFSGGELEQVLPTLGVFAFAGQRLLPALTQMYTNAAKMRYGKPALDAFHADLMESRLTEDTLQCMREAQNAMPLGLEQSIDMLDVDFWYPKADRPALQDINLQISAKSTVGLVGPTGAGKTTVVDIMLGLLTPSQGELRVDGVTIKEKNMSAWQRTLGYVPQQIFLADDTVTANIAFGVPEHAVDRKAVEGAARIADLHDFVIRELPKGYETMVGEQGVRLSGGQRQRIGIARALYYNPDVLIFDEATSALDNITEKAVMQAVQNVGDEKTIIIIAHRLSTVRNCDCIYMLDHGRLIARGTYSELMETCREFQKMAAANE